MTRAGTSKQEPRSPKKLVIREPRLATGNGPLRLDNSARPTFANPTSASLSRSNSLLRASEALQSASNVTTFYAFGNNGEEGEEDRMGANGFDFTPSVNLEDVHRSIIDSDSQTDTYGTESDASTTRINRNFLVDDPV
ncbi:hypothetical protein BJ508DRAFT_101818 [Ascobolus immersus RN42]|uniref:Uncharacterized protein n=1 Tax=Ascobolus immersus RN42 TaxID=1160509 RepID=A0A3N4H997_ASCIM|nr:hypothetical protein BJ508DRAFT_101818 [Ascobolus immersus RN42]